MGKHEDQLRAMGTADAEWKITEFEALEAQMTQLKLDMAAIAKNPGWTGESADAAGELFRKLKGDFARNEKKLAEAKKAIDDANDIRIKAAAKVNNLPDDSVPDWVHTAALVGGAVMVPVPGIGIFAAEAVVQKVNEFMGKQREAAAQEVLTSMESDLVAPKNTLKTSAISEVGTETWPEDTPSPDWPPAPIVWGGDDTGSGSWKTGGGGGGGGKDGFVITEEGYWPPPTIVDPPPYPPVVLPPVTPPGWTDVVTPPSISVDGDTGGSNPNGSYGNGGGLGSGLLGAGAGAGGLGAAKLASKGLGGAGGLFGPNGVLGGGAGAGGSGSGANGAGAGSKAGAGAGAGANGGKGGSNNMMGGGGQGGGSSEKDKRSSLGLMAPKLEDDEETGPRSAAAGAGGRD